MTDKALDQWQAERKAYIETLDALSAQPGPEPLLRRALTELRSLERDVETVIGDDKLADDIDAFLNPVSQMKVGDKIHAPEIPELDGKVIGEIYGTPR
jgi:hypothetical protein